MGGRCAYRFTFQGVGVKGMQHSYHAIFSAKKAKRLPTHMMLLRVHVMSPASVQFASARRGSTLPLKTLQIVLTTTSRNRVVMLNRKNRSMLVLYPTCEGERAMRVSKPVCGTKYSRGACEAIHRVGKDIISLPWACCLQSRT